MPFQRVCLHILLNFEFLENQKSLPPKPIEKNELIISYLDGPRVEFLGKKKESYRVEFINRETGHVVYSDTIKNNMWTRTNIKYCINWKIEVYSNNSLVFQYKWNPEGKRVYIHLDSGALGDTLAWFPYVEEFRKTFKCSVICSTFHNDWFDCFPTIYFY
jgi:autotransporter strand-loop-strand O-heptosyltransferase